MSYIGQHISGTINKEENYKTIGPVVNSVTVETKFVNLTNEYLLICFRDGTYVILPPGSDDGRTGALFIGHGKRGVNVNINIIDGFECEINEKIKAQLRKSNNSQSYWEEVICIDDIKRSRKGLYLENSDAIVILYSLADKIPYHPFCKQNVHNIYLNTLDDFNPNSDVSISLRIICNKGLTPLYYVCINKQLLVITPKKSNTLKDGVYISGLSSLYTDEANSIRRDEYYTLEEISSDNCPLPFFRNLNDARDYLTREKSTQENKDHEKFIQSIKLEKERVEHEHALVKAKMLEQKLELEERESKLQKELAEEKAKSEREILRLKEEGSKVTTETKNNTEWLKLTGVGMVLIMTIAKVLL
jgi:hypothetical protein